MVKKIYIFVSMFSGGDFGELMKGDQVCRVGEQKNGNRGGCVIFKYIWLNLCCKYPPV
jgi:hypothetical protein